VTALSGGPGEIWLDVTRLLTRVGRGALTGIDRVEMAYLDHLLASDGACRFLCRTTRGYLLLGREGGRALAHLATGQKPLDQADTWSRITGRGARPRHRAEATLRPFAVDRCPHWGLSRLLGRKLKGETIYLNTGHANLMEQTLLPLKSAGVEIAVLIHDIIPVSHAQLVPTGQAETFSRKLSAARTYGDLVICNSRDTANRLSALWDDGPDHPAIEVAHLGVTSFHPSAGQDRDPAWFVMIGTLDPRKNHAVILDAWSLLADSEDPAELPHLDIIGAPGWRGAEIEAAIRAHPLFGTHIHLHGPLPDAQLSRHLSRSSALLYPSLAEGFGLPPFEALAHGALPICADLPVLHEVLGAQAVYLPPNDAYSWAETIKQRMAGILAGPDGSDAELPRWQDHFETVSGLLQRPGGIEREGKG